jgi:predicted dehydrogenase
VRSAVCQRLGSPPTWSPDFYKNYARTGGPLYDLHIHDTDFIRWCFGEPREIVSAGTIDHLTTLYRFPESPANPLHVAAEGAQNITPGFGFRMRYTVVFEKATADFDITRTPTLLLCKDGNATAVDAASPLSSAYELEIRHFVAAIAAFSAAKPGAAMPPLTATIEDAIRTTMLLEAEYRGMTTGAAQRSV